MQISFFVPRCTPDNSHGRYVLELAKRIGHEHQVTVHAGAFWPPLRLVVECHLLPNPNRPALARLATFWMASALANNRRPTEIVHVQGADSLVGNVVTAHCCNAAMRAVSGPGSLLRRLNYAVGIKAERYRFTRHSTRAVIAVSRQVARDVQQYYGVLPERIVVIPNGVDAETFNPSHRRTYRAQLRDQLRLSQDDFVALFIGGDYHLKGLIPLLKAAALVPSVRIVAAGARRDSALLNIAQRYRLDGRVLFLGVARDVASLYSMADCFVLPTRYDTFSLTTLEAMASGLPVIVSRAAGVSELLSPNRDSLVLDRPDDVETLARHLDRLVKDEEFRSQLGLEARKTAEQHSWDLVAERTLQVYKDALVCSR
jgi:UDP-glucose:(heptosyl)LPS alpha-1,3-glucosyltransferase